MNTLLNSLLIAGVSSAAALSPMLRVPRSAVCMQAGGPTGDAPAGEVAEAEPAPPKFSVKDLPGITAPLGFFDPIGFCSDATEGKINLSRAQLAMLMEGIDWRMPQKTWRPAMVG